MSQYFAFASKEALLSGQAPLAFWACTDALDTGSRTVTTFCWFVKGEPTPPVPPRLPTPMMVVRFCHTMLLYRIGAVNWVHDSAVPWFAVPVTGAWVARLMFAVSTSLVVTLTCAAGRRPEDSLLVD